MAVVTPKIWSSMDTVALGSSVERDALTMLPNGGYVVTWRENEKIAFQRYDGNGAKVGAKSFVDTPIGSQQFSDVVSYTADGGFVITWTEPAEVTGRILRMQKFNVDGSANGGATTVNATTRVDGAQMAADGSGGWATVYIEIVGNTSTVRLTQFDSTGTASTIVSVANTNGVDRPDVTWLGGTIYAVSYLTESGTSVKIVDSVQGTVGAPADIAGAIEGKVVALKAANGQPSGQFVVVTNAGQGEPILVQKYSANPTTGEITAVGTVVTISPAQDPALPSAGDKVSVTALRDGGYAIAYVSTASGNANIWVKVVDADGQQGPAINVSAEAGLQTMPSIFEMADGRLAVSWQNQSHPTNGAGIETKIVDARATAVTVIGTSKNDIYAPSGHAGDNLDGGDGTDTLTFRGAGAGVAVNLANENGTAGDAAGDTYRNFENIIGSRFSDTLVGNSGGNILDGGAGNDILNGGEGGDRLVGGSGNDTYHVDSSTDMVVETSTGGTMDIIYTTAHYTIANYVERLYASGSLSINLVGNSLANVIKGNAGINKIYGGAGNDTLYGGSGKDYFVFNTALSSRTNKDSIKDWNKTDDTIYLENAVFRKLTKTGTLSSSFFKISSKALDANDYIGYNKATGDLWYDSNGNAAGGQVTFANIGAGKPISNADFVVV
ncbi:calcium-binding protein [Microvirga sp. KLBC 81]|uniref:calcium-binding protein n=1 Tax=Microvirga sp. KLBC 81 TaxID=1862707 RepID=UPI001402863F|nr:calcium-binding protein [Microvirga sp. KLBC 81]